MARVVHTCFVPPKFRAQGSGQEVRGLPARAGESWSWGGRTSTPEDVPKTHTECPSLSLQPSPYMTMLVLPVLNMGSLLSKRSDG